MTLLISLLPCPLAISIAAIFVRRTSTLSRIAAALLWIQLGIAGRYLTPELLSERPDVAIVYGFGIDHVAAFFILVATLVTVAALTHSIGFFAREESGAHPPSRRQVAQFYFFTPLFLLAMYCVVTADNLGYLWIGMEATTLLSAPLVYYYRSRSALEATWKYVIICSVGIALGFFGTAVLYAASQQSGVIVDGSLSLHVLAQHARQLPVGLLRLGFIFMLLGYGTKAGIFPLHSWLPDAHSEAPAPASAMLSGSLLNCALVVLWRVCHLMNLAGQGLLVHETLLPLGTATVVAGALFLLKQRDIKRLLAYSSMENVGLIACAIALGSSSGFALQALNHSLVKVALFLIAGNLLQEFGTKRIHDFRGLLSIQPAQAIVLFLLVLAVAGAPPFGSFLSEWQILATAAGMLHYGVVAAISAALAFAFIALSIHLVDILYGQSVRTVVRANFAVPAASLLLVPGILLAVSLALGVMLTPHIVALAEAIAR